MSDEYCFECNSYLGIDEWDTCPECGAILRDTSPDIDEFDDDEE